MNWFLYVRAFLDCKSEVARVGRMENCLALWEGRVKIRERLETPVAVHEAL